MRKTLLIAAAAFATSVISSQAQVYSQNIVGYVNLSLPAGYSQNATTLDFDGTGTNNTVTTVLGTNLPAGSQLLTWNGTSFSVNSFSIPKHQTVAVWDNPNAPLNPGQGFFINNGGSAMTLTVVGTALVGTNANVNLTPGGGYYAVSSVIPIGGDITTNLQYIPTVNDEVLVWDPAISGYDPYSYSVPKHQTVPVWSPSSPQIPVGQGFFIYTTNTAPTWVQTLNVQ
jgi:hypothetical protein